MNRRDFVKTASAALVLPSAGFGPQSENRVGVPTGSIRFAVASDGHFGQPDTDFKRFHDQMIHWLNDEKAAKGLDFVVFNGDLIHDDPSLLPGVKSHYDRLEVPYYVTRGNHDRVAPATWQATWGYSENHDFELGDCAFLLSSTSNETGEYLCGDLDWLEQRLDRHKQKKCVFVFMHICQMKVTRHAVDCPKITGLLGRSKNVAAVFHGHDHDLDNAIFADGRAYVFDGHFGGSWGTNYHGYRIVEVGQDGEVRTYQCNPEAFYVNRMTVREPGGRQGPND